MGPAAFSPPSAPLMNLESEVSELGPAGPPPSLDCSLGTGFPQPPPSLGAAQASYSWLLILCRPRAMAVLPPLCYSLAQPPPCQLSSSTPDGTPGWLLSLHLGLLPRGATSPLLLMGEPSWGPGSHHLATPLLSPGLLTRGISYGPARAVFGMTLLAFMSLNGLTGFPPP